MRILLSLVFTLVAALPAFASHGPCTKWEKKPSITCIFNGKSASEWVRQCFHQWDNTVACMQQDPNTLTGACTKWMQSEDGIRQCFNGLKWERRWVRGCTERLLVEQFCSDSIDPNTIKHPRLQPVDENDPTRNPNYRPGRRPCAPNTICG
ncbi:MAG: hypothetical protein ABL958_17225 [Bdellovibrionia bacterium]